MAIGNKKPSSHQSKSIEISNLNTIFHTQKRGDARKKCERIQTIQSNDKTKLSAGVLFSILTIANVSNTMLSVCFIHWFLFVCVCFDKNH